MIALRKELDEVQKRLDGDPQNIALREEPSIYLQAYMDATLDEERLLKQKAKIQWLKEGDGNTRFFIRLFKGDEIEAELKQ